MSRLPNPGGDDGQWGSLLNEFLLESHTAAGALKGGAVSNTQLADGSVTAPKLATAAAPTTGQVLSYSGSALSWSTPSGSGSVPDADATTKGLVQLAGDLGGTAAAPTVVGLSAKAADSAVVHNTGTETVAGVKTFSASPIVPTPTTGTQVANKAYVDSVVPVGGVASVNTRTGAVVLTKTDVGLANVDNTSDANKPISSATQTALDAKADASDARFTDQRVPTNGSVTAAKLAAGAPAQDQILSYNGSALNWVTNTPAGTVPDADGTTKGLVTLAGDLGGTAASPTVPGLAGKAADSAVVHNSGDETVAGIKTFSSTIVGSINGNAATVTTNANLTGDVTSVGNATTIAANAVTVGKIADGTITEPKLNITNSPAADDVLSWNGSALAWAAPAVGGGGGALFTPVAKTGNYTAAAFEFVVCDTTSGAIIITLPAPSAGAQVKVKKVSSSGNSVLVQPASGTIDGAANDTCNTQWQLNDYISDGVTWFRG